MKWNRYEESAEWVQWMTKMINGRYKPGSDLKLYPWGINTVLETVFILEE